MVVKSYLAQGKKYIFGFLKCIDEFYNKYFKYILTAWTILVFISIIFKCATLLLVLTTFLWLNNIMYAFKKPYERVLFLLFHGTFFVFLLCRPLIALVTTENWIEFQINNYGATNDSVFRVVYCLVISLLSMRIGAEWFEKSTRKIRLSKLAFPFQNKVMKIRFDSQTVKIVRGLTLTLFVISLIFRMILEIEKIVYIMGHSYVQLYSEFETSMPYIVYVVSSFLPYAMSAYLATLPSKFASSMVLGGYILTTIPTTLGGERSKIVLSVCLTFVYFVFRDFYDSEKKWIGKTEKIIIACVTVVGIVLLGAMNYLREDSSIQMNVFELTTDFFFKQGVTFSWVCAGMAQIGILRNMGVINYTLGSLLDYLLHGSVAQLLFNAAAIPSNNNMAQITMGNQMSHHLSYVVMGSERYLEGHGTGSSYILELYADFDLLGIALFSVVLGIFLVWILTAMKKSFIIRGCALCAVSTLLLMPRSNTVDFISFLWRIPFWITVVYVIAGVLLIKCFSKKDFKK